MLNLISNIRSIRTDRTWISITDKDKIIYHVLFKLSGKLFPCVTIFKFSLLENSFHNFGNDINGKIFFVIHRT